MSKRWTLRVTSSPPASTKGRSVRLPPTHQVAGWLMASAETATPSATGLKMCLRRTVSRNFEAIAAMEARISPKTPGRLAAVTGGMMRVSSSAVM